MTERFSALNKIGNALELTLYPQKVSAKIYSREEIIKSVVIGVVVIL